MAFKLSLLLGFQAWLGCVLGHMYWLDPTPRSSNAGIKIGPCGGAADGGGDFTINKQILAPGWQTLQIQETVHHVGAPYRIALSQVGADVYDCILLNHIPQHTQNTPQTLTVNVLIPDVACDPCALQVISVMTDKIDPGTCCNYLADGVSGTCSSNYHSCANVAITGTQSRSSLTCEQPEWWSYRLLATDSYTQESSSTHWTNNGNGQTLILNGTDAQSICGYVTDPSGATSGSFLDFSDEGVTGGVAFGLVLFFILLFLLVAVGVRMFQTGQCKKGTQNNMKTMSQTNLAPQAVPSTPNSPAVTAP